MSFNPFAQERERVRKVFYITGEPNIVKADCKAGLFLPVGEKATIRNGKDKPIANPAGKDELKMQVIKFGHWANAVLFPTEGADRKAHTWTEVLFVDGKGMVCSVLLKNESRDRFLRLIMNIEAEGEGLKNYTDFVITAAMAPRTSAKFNSDYYAVEFSAEPITAEDLERNIEFGMDRYEEVFSARTAMEFVAQNIPAITDQADRAAAALDFLKENRFVSGNAYEKQKALLSGEASTAKLIEA